MIGHNAIRVDGRSLRALCVLHNAHDEAGKLGACEQRLAALDRQRDRTDRSRCFVFLGREAHCANTFGPPIPHVLLQRMVRARVDPKVAARFAVVLAGGAGPAPAPEGTRSAMTTEMRLAWDKPPPYVKIST